MAGYCCCCFLMLLMLPYLRRPEIDGEPGEAHVSGDLMRCELLLDDEPQIFKAQFLALTIPQIARIKQRSHTGAIDSLW